MATLEESITIDQLARYKAEPGDTIVLRVGTPLTRDTLEELQSRVREQFPEQRTIVLEPWMSLEVVKAGDARELVDPDASQFDTPKGT